MSVIGTGSARAPHTHHSQPRTTYRTSHFTTSTMCEERHLGALADHRYVCRSNHRMAAIAFVTLAHPRATTSPLARATYRPSFRRASILWMG